MRIKDKTIEMKIIPTLILSGALLLSGCSDAHVVSNNLREDAEYFKINRRVVFYNGITGDYMLTIEGMLNIEDQGNQLEVVVETGPDEYKKHFLGLSHNVTYFCEQLESRGVNKYHYKVVFKPTVIIPDIDFMETN